MSTTGSRATVRSGDLGARITVAAAELLDESGDASAVTLRAVARRAGVSAPAIYGHHRDLQSIFLVVVQEAFAELSAALRTAAGTDQHSGAGGGAGVENDGPAGAVARLRATCSAYLDFAARRPQRYRVMFGGLWTAKRAIESSALKRTDVEALGQDALAVFVAALEDCVRTGASTSSDTFADAVALWLGLHGLAHQRIVTAAFPWPADIEQHITTTLAHLTLD